jgi:hypothetical protein
VTSTTTCRCCGAALPATQDWCLECGHAARTTVLAAPAWRRILVSAGLLGVVALAGLVLAFVLATHGDNAVPANATTAAPATGTAP